MNQAMYGTYCAVSAGVQYYDVRYRISMVVCSFSRPTPTNLSRDSQLSMFHLLINSDGLRNTRFGASLPLRGNEHNENDPSRQFDIDGSVDGSMV